MAAASHLALLRAISRESIDQSTQKLSELFGVELPVVEAQRGLNDDNHNFTYELERIAKQLEQLVGDLAKTGNKQPAKAERTRASK